MATPSLVARYFVGAVALGVVAGSGSMVMSPEGRADIAAKLTEAVDDAGEVADDISVAAGITRAREPQPGDFWGGCNDARTAGTAPIYRGEPGYREDMDGDSDGIACEPHH
jgi:Excalibur calcium-binding domain